MLARVFLLLIIVAGPVSDALNPVLFGQNNPSVPGLAAAYSFSEGSGTSVADRSGNKNTLTLTSTTWTASGKTGNALVFNGSTSTSRVVGTNTQLAFTTGFTQMAWVYPTADPGGGEAILLSYYSGSFPYGMVAYDYVNVGGGQPSCYFYDNVTYRVVNAPTKLTLNTWSHVACSYDKQSFKFYVNGALVGTTAATLNVASAGASLYVGDDPGAGDVPLTGRLDDVRLFNRALSASEINTLMNSPVAP